MVQSTYFFGTAALASLCAAAQPAVLVHPVQMNDAFLSRAETGLNTVTGPRQDGNAANAMGSHRNVVYVTQTAYYDPDSTSGPHRRRDAAAPQPNSADQELATKIKPLIQSAYESAVPMMKNYIDSQGNFEDDRAATNAAQMIQMADLFFNRGGMFQKKRRSAGDNVDVEAGHRYVELGARMLASDEGGLQRRSLPSQNDLIKGLKPSMQLAYDAYDTLTYHDFDHAALDTAHKINAMNDGTLQILSTFQPTDASRQLASDMSPLVHYSKDNVDKVFKEYTDSNGNFDSTRATADLVHAIQFAQNYVGRMGTRDVNPVHDMGYFLIDLGSDVLSGSGTLRRRAAAMSQEELTQTLKPIVEKSHSIYTKVVQDYTGTDGTFSYDKLSNDVSVLMTEYSQQLKNYDETQVTQQQGQQPKAYW